jgi:hypothetical protein
MHLAKGFGDSRGRRHGVRRRNHRKSIENVADDVDLEEVYDIERHLLYVAAPAPATSFSSQGVGQHPNSWTTWWDETAARLIAVWYCGPEGHRKIARHRTDRIGG